ncbi:long-chain fatty acid--CoA ligase [Asanoa sp. WMMD1127]|uniref:AMP-dependent synthetase/ligase n=1 Tax=Asanoa sp. WMMD1127 TaxID=3016107 RepID=UPI002415FEEA|nr:long-chain fatty acid--CoA ligase [Asanoa sp. WMMD1127]MDG4827158.1 long-chain fatty acid--CoA ligase [Asanoa sp. WMMD1127]
MREFSVPPVVTVGDAANLTDPVWDNAAEAPDAVQFRRRRDGAWVDVTCGQFRDEVVALARGLVAAGVQPGARVGLMSRTRYEWTLVDYAIWAVGAVTVPVYETSSAEQVRWILEDSGAVALFVETDAHQLMVAGVRGELTALTDVWQIDSEDLDALRQRGATVDAAVIDEQRRTSTADDVATIIYTSGTTGRPKGCVLTHRNLLSDIANAVPVLPDLFHQGASTLLFLPLAHSFARLIQIGMVQARATMGHLADTKTLVDDLKEFQPTFLLSVPRVFEKVHTAAKQRATADGKGGIFAKAEQTAIAYSTALDGDGPGLGLRMQHALYDKLVYGKLRAALGGKCTRAISGGAPLGARLAHFFRGIGVAVYEGYGLTETSPAVAVNLESATRIGTVGRPLPGVTVRVADDNEILVKGPLVFKEYWRNPAATAEVLDDDGWFATGDLGRLDDDGFLSITGRKKEIIVTAAGKNVAPAVLEDRIRAHHLVSQAMVIGDRERFIAALVTVDEEALPRWLESAGLPADTPLEKLRTDERLRADIQSAIDDANQAVSQAEAIKEFRILPADFTEATGELTPSLKVKRAVVLKAHQDVVDEIYRR